MKSKYLLIPIFALLISASSCSDFLNEEPRSNLDSGSLFRNQDELNASVYPIFRFVADAYRSTSPQDPQWMGDDITTDAGSNKQAPREFDAFAATDNNIGSLRSWTSSFKIVKVANDVIMNAEKTPTSKEEINIALGQAKYWRAFSYFKLVRIFGEVPMNLDNKLDYEKKLSSIEDIYTQIVKDLKEAEPLLPDDYNDVPRKVNGINAYVTTQAVKATLSAVYMAMAGYPLKKTELYAEAAKKAKEVIDGVDTGKYNFILEPEFKFVYAPSHNYSKEIVVGINMSPFGSQSASLPLTNVFMSLGGWGDAWGEIKFWKDMPAGPRKDAIYNPKIYMPKDGEKLVDWWEKRKDGTPYIPEYHPMFSIFTVGENNTDYDYKKIHRSVSSNGQNMRFIRYSEVLLWYAESQARADGTPNQMAYDCINKVRKRAGIENLPAGLSGEEFAQAALQEHGWEVAGYYPAMVTRRADQLRAELLQKTFEERVKNTPIEVAPGVFAKEVVEIKDKWDEMRIYAARPNTDTSLNPNIK